MATATTQWPSHTFPTPIKDLFTLFCALIESHAEDVGQRLADEVFTTNGIMQSGTQRFAGREGLIASRASAWTHIASRKHVIRRVYTASVEEVGEHVVMLGDLNLVLKNGTELEIGFATRMMVDNAESAEPRIELCQVWADSAPLMKALSESKAGPEDGDHEQAVSHSS